MSWQILSTHYNWHLGETFHFLNVWRNILIFIDHMADTLYTTCSSTYLQHGTLPLECKFILLRSHWWFHLKWQFFVTLKFTSPWSTKFLNVIHCQIERHSTIYWVIQNDHEKNGTVHFREIDTLDNRKWKHTCHMWHSLLCG